MTKRGSAPSGHHGASGFFTDPDGLRINGVYKWDGTTVSSVESDATPGAVNPNYICVRDAIVQRTALCGWTFQRC